MGGIFDRRNWRADFYSSDPAVEFNSVARYVLFDRCRRSVLGEWGAVLGMAVANTKRNNP